MNKNLSDIVRFNRAKEVARNLLAKELGSLSLLEKALLMTVFSTDVYARERIDASGAFGLTMSASNDRAEPLQTPSEYQQDAILQALREAFFELEVQADPDHKNYAYYKILRLKQADGMPRRTVFVAKGTDTLNDWIAQNFRVNGRFSNYSPHLEESTIALLKHFIEHKHDQFEYWLTGHSLAGHLVQQLSAMIYGLAYCDHKNKLFQYVFQILSEEIKDTFTLEKDSFKANCQSLSSKIKAVWAVDPPGTFHIINSFLTQDFGFTDEDVKSIGLTFKKSHDCSWAG